MTPTPEQLAKLPKWAQDHIRNLQQKLDVAVSRHSELCDNSKPGPFFTRGNYDEKKLYVPDDRIAFAAPGEIEPFTLEINPSRYSPSRLEVRAYRGRITVSPDCANVISIGATEL